MSSTAPGSFLSLVYRRRREAREWILASGSLPYPEPPEVAEAPGSSRKRPGRLPPLSARMAVATEVAAVGTWLAQYPFSVSDRSLLPGGEAGAVLRWSVRRVGGGRPARATRERAAERVGPEPHCCACHRSTLVRPARPSGWSARGWPSSRPPPRQSRAASGSPAGRPARGAERPHRRYNAGRP